MVNRRSNDVWIFILIIMFMGFYPDQCLSSQRVQSQPLETGKDHSTDACSVMMLHDRDYFSSLIRAVDGAQREIVMSFFYFKTNGYKDNYPDIVLDHLIRASKRGVSVRILLERGKDASSKVDRHNRETAARLRGTGIIVAFDSPRITNHTKVIVIDGRSVLLGSHNLTASALKYNNELSVLIESPAVAREIIRYIDSLFP